MANNMEVNPAAAPSPAVYRKKTKRNYATEIDVLRTELIDADVPIPCFNEQNVVNFGWSQKDFYKHLSVFRQFDDKQKLQDMLLVGRDMNMFATIDSLTPTVFYEFLVFLKSPEGQKQVQAVLRKIRLFSKASDVLTFKDVAVLSLLREQRAAEARKRNAVKKEWDEKVEKAEQKLLKLRRKRADAVAAVAEEFVPAAEIPEMPTHLLNTRCWDMYVKSCAADKLPPKKLNWKNATIATETFHAEVEDKWAVEYCSAPERLEKLKQFGRDVILHFRNLGDVRGENNFQAAMDALDGKLLATVPAGGTQEDGATDSSGESSDGDPDIILRTPLVARTEQRRAAEEGEGDEGQANAQQEVGDEPLHAPPAKRKQKNKSGKARKSQRIAGNPAGEE